MITTMTDDSLEARQVNSHFDEALSLLLEEHDWSFAIERQQLTKSVTIPIYEYSYKHSLPSTPYCLRVLDACDGDADPLVDYKVEGRFILSDSETVKIRYICLVDDLNKLSPLFRTALAYLLASMIAVSLTGASSVEQDMERKYIYFLRRAITADSKQGTDDDVEDEDFEWINARFSG
jgi:hypothetical protein